MHNPCGNFVETMRTTVRKKCARIITVGRSFIKNSVQPWIISRLLHYPYTPLSSQLSTLLSRLITSVEYVVLPIIHSTYYKYYQFDRKEL